MNIFTRLKNANNSHAMLNVWFTLAIILAALIPTMSKQVKLHCDSSHVTWYRDGKLLEEPGDEVDYQIALERIEKNDDGALRSTLLVKNTNPGSHFLCKSNITGKELLKKIIEKDMFITEVDACVTGLFCFVALLTDILIVSSFFKNSKKGKKLQIGFTSLASVGLLFDAGWAFFLWYEYKIRGLEFYMLCVANGFILISVIVSYVHLFWGRKSRTYQTVNNGKEESSKTIVQV